MRPGNWTKKYKNQRWRTGKTRCYESNPVQTVYHPISKTAWLWKSWRKLSWHIPQRDESHFLLGYNPELLTSGQHTVWLAGTGLAHTVWQSQGAHWGYLCCLRNQAWFANL